MAKGPVTVATLVLSLANRTLFIPALRAQQPLLYSAKRYVLPLRQKAFLWEQKLVETRSKENGVIFKILFKVFFVVPQLMG